MDRISVGACWIKANREYPADPDRRRLRFVELMREQGHIVPGKQRPLPCGWMPKRRG